MLEIIKVEHSGIQDGYTVTLVTDIIPQDNGVPTEVIYNLVPNDNFGIAPQVREALTVWLKTNTAQAYTKPPVTIQDVNLEADSRICQVVGASDKVECLAKQQSYSNFLERLKIAVDEQGYTPTEEEQLKKQKIIEGYDLIERIVAVSNALTAMSPIPLDFTNDKYWPPISPNQ